MKPFDTYKPDDLRVIAPDKELLSVLKSLVRTHEQLVQMAMLASNPVVLLKEKDR